MKAVLRGMTPCNTVFLRLCVRLLPLCVCVAMVVSCSTKKNTSLTRFWHGFTAHYNIYYNGTLAYIDASLEKENGNKDNYTERIPLYTVGNKASRDLGKGNYETAITKAEKAIQLHSIKAKPEWNKDRRKTEKDIEWLSRKEYNPFIWRAWMLMGRSQFYKGSFDEAAATFSYMSRLYKGQPAIYGKARAWLAKCYIESGWIYDAEDVIRNMQRDSIDWRAQKEWDYTLCDYYLHTDNIPEAVNYLRRVIKHEMRRKQRAREYYLLGQLEAAQGNRQEAFDAFKKVVRLNPPYELAFNARISMTEVMAAGQSKKMISKLRRMARDDNNKDYLDQVYYAMGNIYLAEGDTTSAIGAYEKGNVKATRSGVEKGVLLLHLGDLYWQLEKYGDAQRCYGEAIGMLDKERPDYEELSKRSKVLDELAPYTESIHLQDSLLALSVMPEKERISAIDRVIKALRDKEKEEESKKTEAELEKRQQKYGNPNMQPKNNPPTLRTPSAQGQAGAWYFYNMQAVAQGKQTFQRIWGRRENVDDWQRSNRTVVGQISDMSSEPTDSLDEDEDETVSLEGDARGGMSVVNDSLAQDPHTREYYLAQIPFTDEQKATCHDLIKEGLVKSAIIFKDKLDNLRLSEKQFDRLLRDYPDYDPKDEVYYHLFLLHSRKGEHDVAKTYVDSLKECCPESKYTILLTDPYYAENAKFGKHIEDSLYGATYEAFKNDRFQEVYDNVTLSETRFPLGDNRDRFIFFYGMTKLNDGDGDECVAAMERIIKEYPESSVSTMAGMIINGVRSGKKLHGAKFDLSDVWNRRGVELSATAVDSTRTFSAEKNTDYLFMMAYAPDSVAENQLLFQMARYNFTSFMVRSFDIDIEDSYGMHHMIVSGFRNFDEARQYSRLLLQQENIRKTMGKARPIVISEENLALIGARYSYNDYDTFYVNHFAPLPMGRPDGLYDAVDVQTEQPVVTETGQDEEGNDVRLEPDPVKPILPTEEVAPGGAKPIDETKKDEEGESYDNSMDIPVGTEVAIPSEEETFSLPQQEEQQKSDDSFDIPAEQSQPVAQPQSDDSFDIPAEQSQPAAQPQSDDSFDIPAEQSQPAAQPKGDDGFDIPAEQSQPAAQPQSDDGFDIPAEQSQSAAQPQSDDSFDIPAEQSQPAAQPKSDDGFDVMIEQSEPTAKSSSDDEIEITDSEDVKSSDDGEVIEIVDGDASEKTGKDADETFEFSDDDNKKSSRDLEDEYYELDGF